MRPLFGFIGICQNRTKVTNMGGTFLSKDGNCFQILTTKTASEMVTDMVGTFLIKEANSFRAQTTKMELKKVTNTVGTFWQE
ncbi:hypothetical protein [Emticicia sp. C21]|uniref:hypothetical protein n=1 Tax=Emticicia sp. C21 TaxID=2302915 RepID=UPI000E34A46D|nr:hypothetical protein [Emticicia sp. C21]RFS13903.1 hypothetical protein D0T08_24530 [Emticicia sp. C21]